MRTYIHKIIVIMFSAFLLVPILSVSAATTQDDNLPLYAFESNGVYGFMNENGEVIIQPAYLLSSSVEDMLFDKSAMLVRDINGQQCVIDKTGKRLFNISNSDSREEILSFSPGDDGTFAIETPIGWYHIDSSGEQLYSEKYYSAKPFHEGYAVVAVKGALGDPPQIDKPFKYSYITRNGMRATENEFDNASDFIDHYAIVKQGDKTVVINSDFETISGSWKVNVLDNMGNGLFRVSDGKYFGIINSTGNWIIPCEYERVFSVESNSPECLFGCEMEGQTTIISQTGKIELSKISGLVGGLNYENGKPKQIILQDDLGEYFARPDGQPLSEHYDSIWYFKTSDTYLAENAGIRYWINGANITQIIQCPEQSTLSGNLLLCPVVNDDGSRNGFYYLDKQGKRIQPQNIDMSGDVAGIANPFKDVSETDPYYKDILWGQALGLMVGKEASLFAPDDIVTRAQFLTVLYRYDGSSEVTAKSNFADVSPQSYYFVPISWAYNAGIICGINETEFAPNDTITREQAAVILNRYFLWKGLYNKGASGGYVFEDAKDITSYAKDAVLWSQTRGIYITTSALLEPQKGVIRAETIALIHRFSNNMTENN